MLRNQRYCCLLESRKIDRYERHLAKSELMKTALADPLERCRVKVLIGWWRPPNIWVWCIMGCTSKIGSQLCVAAPLKPLHCATRQPIWLCMSHSQISCLSHLARLPHIWEISEPIIGMLIQARQKRLNPGSYLRFRLFAKDCTPSALKAIFIPKEV